MRTLAAAGVFGFAGLLWSGAGAQVQPHPTPGSGVVTVAGTVNAAQAGEWKVALANTADVRIANTPAVTVPPPRFLQTGEKYQVVWMNGDREVVTIQQISPDGWLRVTAEDGSRWINVAAARSLQATR